MIFHLFSSLAARKDVLTRKQGARKATCKKEEAKRRRTEEGTSYRTMNYKHSEIKEVNDV